MAKQAADIITEETTTTALVPQLDVSIYTPDGSYPGQKSASFDAMFKAILLEVLEDYSDPEVATALGFDPGNIPSRMYVHASAKLYSVTT